MIGTVTSPTRPATPRPPPPPPPLSEQPFGNDTPPLSVFEVRDTVVPKLDRVKVSRVARGVRVKFRLSEAGKVTVKATRGRSVTTRTVEVAKGTRSITVKGLKAGELPRAGQRQGPRGQRREVRAARERHRPPLIPADGRMSVTASWSRG